MPTADDRPAAIASALRDWLRARFGGTVTEASPSMPIAGGFDCIVVAVHFRGDQLPPEWTRPLVLRAPPDPLRYPAAQRETQLQAWCADHGYVAPKPLALLAPGEIDDFPVQVCERAPGTTMTAAMTTQPWRLPTLVRRLANSAADLHALPVPPWANGIDWSLAERRLALPRHLATLLTSPALESALAAVERLLPRLQTEQPAMCHGDFHPFNVLVDRDRLTVIDWTDAGLGDAHGDVARTLLLFRLVGTAAPSVGARAALGAVGPAITRGYLRAYSRRRPVDPGRLRLWAPVHLLQLWAQVLGDEEEVFGPSTGGDRYRRGLGATLHAELERALASI